MTPFPRRRGVPGGAARPVAALLVFAALLAWGCGDGARHTVEVVNADAQGRKLQFRVACSDEVYPAFQRLASDYALRHGVGFDLFQVQSVKIPDILKSGGADLGVTGRNLSARAAADSMVYVPLAYDGAVFLAAADAGVRSLTSAQLARIYDGKVGNWKQVGGADRPIRLVDRPQESSTRVALAKAFFGGNLPASSVALALETSESAYYAMRSLSGYIAFAPLSRTVVEQFPSVPLAVDGHLPLASNIGKGPYPARLEYGLMFPRGASQELNDFVGYLLSTDGIHQIASLGLVPAVESLSLASCHCRATEGAFTPVRKGALAGTFTLALVPELGAIEQEKRYAGIARAIADGMQVNIQVKHLGSYDEVVREFGEGRIDGAFVGSLVYGRLHRRFAVAPVARPSEKGVSHYRGLLLVKAPSLYRSPSHLRGRTVAAVRNTSAGELTLVDTAREAGGGAAPEQFFGRIVWVPSHGDAVRLLEAGKVDGAFVKDRVLQRLVASDPALGGAFRVLHSSSPFPENALVVSSSLDGKQVERLRKVLVELPNTEGGRKALTLLGADLFVPTADEDYRAVYAMAGKAGLDLSAPPAPR